MNTQQAKEISIIDLLTKYDMRFINSKMTDFWYLSLFRKETKPSFKVNSIKNIWFDYGAGIGGNIIDFVIKYENCNLSEALKIIETKTKHILNSITSIYPVYQQNDNLIKIQKSIALQDKALIYYACSERKISYKIAKIYLNEIYFTNGNNKTYWSLGFKNDKGGYELRNKLFKGCSSPKYLTTIRGTKPENKKLNVFEGFFDFLSMLQFYNTLLPKNNTIILNSLTFTDECIKIAFNYDEINLFLDNDNAGIETVLKFENNHENVINQAQKIYKEFKDFNDFFLFTSKK